MYFDLNVPVPGSGQPLGLSQSKKGKGKQVHQPNSISYTAAQISVIEDRIDLLIHLGYAVIAFTQTILKKVDAKTHVNALDPLLPQLRKRAGVVFLKRLTIILDDESEKGTGLTGANVSLLSPYDLIAVVPTTPATFSLACLTLSVPSQQTTHIIAIPLTLPRLPFLKHTLIRTAIKNGVVFEINYSGALGGVSEPCLVDAGAAESGISAKRNWWAGARELTRVTKGKGLIISGGVVDEGDLRAPRDVGNLITLLGLPQNIAHDSSTKTPKSLVLRAQTRRTYRAVFSEPRLVVPPTGDVVTSSPVCTAPAELDGSTNRPDPPVDPPKTSAGESEGQSVMHDFPSDLEGGKKRPRNDFDDRGDLGQGLSIGLSFGQEVGREGKRKKKKKSNKEKNISLS